MMRRSLLLLALLLVAGCHPRIVLETADDPELMEWRKLVADAVNSHERRLQALEDAAVTPQKRK